MTAELKQFRPKISGASKLLLVDDDPLQLRTREAILRNAGFEVCIATNAESALAILRADPVASQLGTIITDHMMPDMSGVEFVRQLRLVNPNIPVIVLSGFPDVEEEYQGLNIQFRQKPCPPLELIALVKDSTKRAA